MPSAMLAFCSTSRMAMPWRLSSWMISKIRSTYSVDSPIEGSSVITFMHVMLDEEDRDPHVADQGGLVVEGRDVEDSRPLRGRDASAQWRLPEREPGVLGELDQQRLPRLALHVLLERPAARPFLGPVGVAVGEGDLEPAAAGSHGDLLVAGGGGG